MRCNGSRPSCVPRMVESETIPSRAPSFSEVAADVLAILDGAVIVAHAASWDVAFLEAELARCGRPATFLHFLDTLELARRAFGFRRHALDALCKELGIERQRAHRAADDVRALRGVFSAIVRELVPGSPRDLWHVKVAARHVRPHIVAKLEEARGREVAVRLRYRPSGKGAFDLDFVVTSVESSLDPPRVLGYALPSRARRELRIDRVLSVELHSREP
jgi:DNA polymerase-3 subunit epsilon